MECAEDSTGARNNSSEAMHSIGPTETTTERRINNNDARFSLNDTPTAEPASIYESFHLRANANDRQESTFLMNNTTDPALSGLDMNMDSMDFRTTSNDLSRPNNQFSNASTMLNMPVGGSSHTSNDVLQTSHGINISGDYGVGTSNFGNGMLSAGVNSSHIAPLNSSNDSMNRALTLGSPDESLDSSKHSRNSSLCSSVHDVRDSIGSGDSAGPPGFENKTQQQGISGKVGLSAAQDFAYQVHFKRKHQFFLLHPSASILTLRTGDYVIVEADRGQDLGIVREVIQAKRFWAVRYASISKTDVKTILRLATPQEVHALSAKTKDEETVVNICGEILSTAHSLPTNIVDAEYQFDRNKLTLYHNAMQRIDFREYVRDLFTVFKTRIWMQHITGEHSGKGRNRGNGDHRGVERFSGGSGGNGGMDRRYKGGMQQQQGHYSYEQPQMAYVDPYNQQQIPSNPPMNALGGMRPMSGVLPNQLSAQGMQRVIGGPVPMPNNMQGMPQMHLFQQGSMQDGLRGMGFGAMPGGGQPGHGL